jgi:hypothetical protein
LPTSVYSDRQAFSAFCGLKVDRSDARNIYLCRSAVASFEERLADLPRQFCRVHRGAITDQRGAANERASLCETPACYAPDLAVRSEKGVGGKDRQTSAGIGLARFMTIRADKASQKRTNIIKTRPRATYEPDYSQRPRRSALRPSTLEAHYRHGTEQPDRGLRRDRTRGSFLPMLERSFQKIEP